MPTFSPEFLADLATKLLRAVGTPEDNAHAVSESLVEANMLGHDSHGVIRLMSYVALVRSGQIIPDAQPQLVTHQGASARVDGAWGWGQIAARLARKTTAAAALEYGAGVTTIDRCNHIGRLGEYVTALAQDGLIGLACCNAEAVVAPFGGRERLMGTNPIAIAAPRGDGLAPLLVDFATAGVAEGKLRVARAKGEQVAPGLLLDSAGHPSQDPADFYDGGVLLPFGGHKGFGLSVMIEVLGGALSGMAPSALPEYRGGNGTLLMALKIDSFVPLAQFSSQIERLGERISTSAPASGFDEVLLPGEPEVRARAQREQQGITLPETTWTELRTLARELAIDIEE